jgi:hypothetical protein
MEVLSLDRDEGVAWFLVGPRPEGPRPPLFVDERFRVRLNEVVGTQAMRFDYATGYAFRRVYEVPETETREIRGPVFTPAGTVARDAGGNPRTRIYRLERRVARVRIQLKKDGAPDLDLPVPR